MKRIYTVLWVVLTILPILNYLLKPPPPPDFLILFANTLVAGAVGGLLAHDVWTLKVRSWPLVVDVLIYMMFIFGFLALIYLKEAGVWNWNDTHLDFPVFVFLGVPTVAVWITEAKKGVKVYVSARKLIFVKAHDGL
ncbi:MAG: hypothetical protein NT159_23775 [Proteobacteria bacterium]|nr:hypothetical protein [Pseudomonadota bacterium]